MILGVCASTAHADPAASMWTWLANNPRVESSVIWVNPVSGVERKISSWTQAERDSLTAAYNLLSTQGSAGLSESSPQTPNISGANVTQARYTTNTAWAYWVAFVAQSLVVEVEQKVPWSVVGFSDRELAMLFHSKSLYFGLVGDGTVYIRDYISGTYAAPAGAAPVAAEGPLSVTLGDPGRLFAFLRDTGLIDSSTRGTTERVANWARLNMVHYLGGNDTANLAKHWQYEGFSPVERVISGTSNPDVVSPTQPSHWTAGCWGTSGFLNLVLRTANIPVVTFQRSGHALPYFTRDSVYLTHGDDPYNALTRSTPNMPVSWFLINQTQFDSWFDLSIPGSWAANVGIGPYQAAVDKLPIFLLQAYGRDSAANKSHAAGEVCSLLSGHFTKAQLEAGLLWDRMDAKIAAAGGAASLPAADIDTTGPNAWYVNDGSRTGDSFCAVVGLDTYDGLRPQSPRRTLTAVWSFLTPGDTIYLDAGAYSDALSFSVDSISIIGRDSLTTVIDVQDSDLIDGFQALIVSGANLHVENLGLANAVNGLVAQGLRRSHLHSVRVSSLSGMGMLLYANSDSNTIENCEVTRAQSGISIWNSNGNVLVDNVCAVSVDSGFDFMGSSGNLLVRNRSRFNGGNGFSLTASSLNNTFQQNTTESNAGWGVFFDATITGTVMTRNNLAGSSAHPDSVLYSAAGSLVSAPRNWWGRSDSATIFARIQGAGRGAVTFQPWRLGPVDTAAGADTTAPLAPVLTGSDSPYPNLRIFWNASLGNEDGYAGAPGVTSYTVYRAASAQPSVWTRLGETTSLVFTDTSAASGTVYSYAVTARDNAPVVNESYFSASLSGRASRLPGDFSGDASVTLIDLWAIQPRYRVPLSYDELYDIGRNGPDGVIDAEDFFELGRRFGP